MQTSYCVFLFLCPGINVTVLCSTTPWCYVSLPLRLLARGFSKRNWPYLFSVMMDFLSLLSSGSCSIPVDSSTAWCSCLRSAFFWRWFVATIIHATLLQVPHTSAIVVVSSLPLARRILIPKGVQIISGSYSPRLLVCLLTSDVQVPDSMYVDLVGGSNQLYFCSSALIWIQATVYRCCSCSCNV